MTDTTAATSNAPLQLTIQPAAQAPASFWSSDAPSFKDVLDTINPLQHIPIVSTLYQALTGNTQSTGAKLAGGTLYGGPLGFLAALTDSIVQSGTGATIPGHIIAAAGGAPVPSPPQTTSQIAANTPLPDHLSANQRAGYNAYVNASILT